MYIVRRSAQVAGFPGLDWAVMITKVVQDAGVPASLWVGGPGTVPGSVSWSVPVDSFAGWAALNEQLMADAAYRDAGAAGRDVVLGYQPDSMLEVVHGQIDGPAPVGAYLGGIEATAHPDRSAEAMAFAVEVAGAWTEATGVGVVVATLAAGDMSTVQWLARYDDAGAIDEANGKIAASSQYAEVLAKGQGLFTTGNRLFGRRVA